MENKNLVFKVSFSGRCYRNIEIRGDKSLFKFAEAITKAFDFYFDHAFAFYDDAHNIMKSTEAYELFVDMPDLEPVAYNAKSVEKTKINEVFIVGKKLDFYFDYGDDWIFGVECIAEVDPQPKMRYPMVVKTVGKAPEQYPDHG